MGNCRLARGIVRVGAQWFESYLGSQISKLQAGFELNRHVVAQHAALTNLAWILAGKIYLRGLAPFTPWAAQRNRSLGGHCVYRCRSPFDRS
jgi:hypothetical protein